MNSGNSDSTTLALILIVFGLIVYFIPAMVGHGKRNFPAILVLNIFLGWTVLGWIGALIWAMVEKPVQ
jgi:hypothetical protein